MNVGTRLAMAALLALAPLGDARAQPGPEPAAAAARTQRERNLDIVVNFFLPERPAHDLLRGAVETSFRNRLQTHPDYVALNRSYPGITERMMAAASAAGDTAIPSFINGVRSDVRGAWSDVSDQDLIALASLMGDPSVTSFTESGIGYQPNDLPSQAMERTADADRDARFQRRAAEFAQSPAGQRLNSRVVAYQASLQPRLEAGAVDTMRAVARAAQRAANDFVRQSFPDRPLPYPDPS